MGHIQDRWYKEVPDLENSDKTVRVPAALHGKGLRYKVRYIDPDGQERSKSYPDKKLKDARAFLARVETDKLTGDYIDPKSGKTTLREYCGNWLKGQSQDEGLQRTMRFKLEKQVYPSLGARSLSAIDAAAIRDWLSWMNGNNISESHKSQIFDLLSAVLSSAADEKKIRTNPCKAKGVKKPVPDKRKITPWSENRLRKLQLALPPRQSVVIPVGSGLGLRQGEILGLSPDDIDREQMTVHVDRQLAYVGNRPLFKLPKGRKTRIVPISRGLLENIDDYMDAHHPVTITLPWGKTTGDPVSVRLLIVNDARGVDTGCDFNWRHWKPAFARAGLTYVEGDDGMHALRHFYASTLLVRGVTIKELAEYCTSATRTQASRCGRTRTCCPPAMNKRGGPSTASSNRVVRRTWCRVLGRPDDGPDGYGSLVIAGQRRGTEEARFLLATLLVGATVRSWVGAAGPGLFGWLPR